MDKATDRLSAVRIREIRLSTGMTQQQLADKIAVGKVTVARWETGARKCLGDYARRVRRISAVHNAELVPTTRLFDLAAKDLPALEATAAVEAFRDLLW